MPSPIEKSIDVSILSYRSICNKLFNYLSFPASYRPQLLNQQTANQTLTALQPRSASQSQNLRFPTLLRPTPANFQQNQPKSYAAAVSQTSQNQPFVNQSTQLLTVGSGRTAPQSQMTAEQAQMVGPQMTAQHQLLMTVPQQPLMTGQQQQQMTGRPLMTGQQQPQMTVFQQPHIASRPWPLQTGQTNVYG